MKSEGPNYASEDGEKRIKLELTAHVKSKVTSAASFPVLDN